MKPVFQTKFRVGPDVEPEERGNCMQACVASLLELPLEEVPHFMSYGEAWYTKLLDFLHSKGLAYRGHGPEEPPEGYAMACGQSPRGNWKHGVIVKDGVMVHDPHPSGDGVLSYEWYETIHPWVYGEND